MAAEVTVLDGGMGQELIKRAGKATDMWSLKALMEAPEMVRAVHEEYFAAGAQVATSNTYMCLPDRLDPKGYADQLEPLTVRACELAAQARDAHGSGLVAGSLGPQGFSYQVDTVPPAEHAAAVYARVAAYMGDLVDVFLLETMASLNQARGGLMGAGGHGKPVWIGLTVDDSDGTKLRSGEPLSEMGALVAEFSPEAILINCSKPEAVAQSLPVLADMGVTVGAYANGFTGIAADFNSIHATVDLLSARKDLGPEDYLHFAKGWATEGATLIGGCCEVGPDHIAALSAHFGKR